MDDTPIHEALREALANCLINADYYGRQGIVIEKNTRELLFFQSRRVPRWMLRPPSAAESPIRGTLCLSRCSTSSTLVSGLAAVFPISLVFGANRAGLPRDPGRVLIRKRITVSLIIGHETQVIDTNTDNSQMETDNTPNASGKHRENRYPRRLKTAMQEDCDCGNF